MSAVRLPSFLLVEIAGAAIRTPLAPLAQMQPASVLGAVDADLD